MSTKTAGLKATEILPESAPAEDTGGKPPNKHVRTPRRITEERQNTSPAPGSSQRTAKVRCRPGAPASGKTIPHVQQIFNSEGEAGAKSRRGKKKTRAYRRLVTWGFDTPSKPNEEAHPLPGRG